MPAHIRKRLRDAAIAQLLGLPHTGDRVFAWQTDPLTASQLPAIKVLTPESGATTATMTIEAIASAESDIDSLVDWIDEISVDLAAAVDADPTFGGVARDAVLTGEAVAVDSEGELSVVVVSFQYRVEVDPIGNNTAVKVNGALVKRLRSVGLTQSAPIADITASADAWRTRKSNVAGGWSAVIEFRRDPADAAQVALALKAVNNFEFFTAGLSFAALSGAGIVSEIDDAPGADGENIRTVTIAGTGALA